MYISRFTSEIVHVSLGFITTTPLPLECKLHLIQLCTENTAWHLVRHSINICRINYLINYCVIESWKCTRHPILIPESTRFSLFKLLPSVCLIWGARPYLFSPQGTCWHKYVIVSYWRPNALRSPGMALSSAEVTGLGSMNKADAVWGQEPKGQISSFPTQRKVKI